MLLKRFETWNQVKDYLYGPATRHLWVYVTWSHNGYYYVYDQEQNDPMETAIYAGTAGMFTCVPEIIN